MGKKKKPQAAQASDGYKVIDVNKKARRDFEIRDTFEAGIALLGSEVKSIRDGGVNLRDSYIRFKNGECYLVGCHVSPYKFSSHDAPDPIRDRKLLLHKRDIEKLGSQVQAKGLTLVPLKIYFNKRGRCKLEVALGRGKKLYDKREDIKAREAARQMERVLKSRK